MKPPRLLSGICFLQQPLPLKPPQIMVQTGGPVIQMLKHMGGHPIQTTTAHVLLEISITLLNGHLKLGMITAVISISHVPLGIHSSQICSLT